MFGRFVFIAVSSQAKARCADARVGDLICASLIYGRVNSLRSGFARSFRKNGKRQIKAN
jgi:hypothetical protein